MSPMWSTIGCGQLGGPGGGALIKGVHAATTSVALIVIVEYAMQSLAPEGGSHRPFAHTAPVHGMALHCDESVQSVE